MSAPLIELAEAIVESLNAETFSQGFTAKRGYLPKLDMEKLTDLHVTVIPKSLGVIRASRATAFIDPTIEIAIQKKVGIVDDVVDQAEADALTELVHEILLHLHGRRLEGAPKAAWQSMTNDPVYAVEHLNDFHVFTSLISVTYRTQQR